MTAVIQVHCKYRVAGGKHRHERRKVCLRAGVRLHVHMVIGLKSLFPLFAAVLLHLVGIDAAAVVAALPAESVIAHRRVALTVFVRKAGAHRLEHILADEVLARYKLNILALPFPFLFNDLKNFRFHALSSVAYFLINMIFRSQSVAIPGTSPVKLYCHTVCA